MSSATFYTGDVLQVLAKFPDQSVDLVLTSPPFLALRSYLPADHPDKALEGGSQSTPGEFIDWLLDVVEACDRVLAPHGSMCFELGDTFAGSGGAGGDHDEDGLWEGKPKFRQTPGWHRGEREGRADGAAYRKEGTAAASPNGGSGWPADKSLTLIPETFRFALAYGFNPHTGRKTQPWRIRNVIRWVRPNPPVGSLGDKFRPATSEMVVFCRTDEAGRKRYFDLDAVREPFKGGTPDPLQGESAARVSDETHAKSAGTGARRLQTIVNTHAGAPPLDWWNIPTHPYKGAHYATFPPELCVKPIKAMSPEQVCVTCGEPSRRIAVTMNAIGEAVGRRSWRESDTDGIGAGHSGEIIRSVSSAPTAERATLGWTDCGCSGGHCSNEYACDDHWRPGVVLDPFAGSGTTLAVAVGHGRDAIGIDLDERNRELARDRVGPMFFHEA